MAVGDISRDTGSPKIAGGMRVLTGTIELDDDTTAFALVDTKSRLLDVQLIDNDGVGTASCTINVNAAGTATNGSISAFGNHQSVDTYRFLAHYI
jgi:hypothetical protein